MSDATPPSLVVISGPSGSGKSTLISRLLETGRCRLAISATTRGPRPGEKDGVHYRFVTQETFAGWRERDELLEWAEVYGEFYGTPRAETEDAEGRMVLLDIDVQGWRSVLKAGLEVTGVFIAPPDLETLEARLRGRGTEDEDRLRRRLDAAAREMSASHEYHHEIVNDDLERAAAELLAALHLEAREA